MLSFHIFQLFVYGYIFVLLIISNFTFHCFNNFVHFWIGWWPYRWAWHNWIKWTNNHQFYLINGCCLSRRAWQYVYFKSSWYLIRITSRWVIISIETIKVKVLVLLRITNNSDHNCFNIYSNLYLYFVFWFLVFDVYCLQRHRVELS